MLSNNNLSAAIFLVLCAVATFGIDREETFEFTEVPKIEKHLDRWVIKFGVASRCDVSVAIEDSEGRVVTLLGSGVLGSNAPAPFIKDSLNQTIEWDLTDMAGKPVQDVSRCFVRVSLGLSPVLNRMVLEHKKDMTCYENVEGIVADSAGVYVLSYGMGTSQLKMFDHDGNYVKTLVPFSSSALSNSQLYVNKHQIEKQNSSWLVPGMAFNAGLSMPYTFERYEYYSSPSRLSVGGGWIVWLSDWGELLRIKADGTTGGLPFPGPRVPFPPFINITDLGQYGSANKAGRYWRSALSPDGQYAYLIGTNRDILLSKTAFEYGVNRDSSILQPIWRVRVDASDFGVPAVLAKSRANWPTAQIAPFIAAPSIPLDSSRDLISAPRGIACDSDGIVYVCDSLSIKAYSAEGVHVKTILNNDTIPPIQIEVSKKTGAIYLLLSKRLGTSGTNLPLPHKVVVKKLKSLEDPSVVFKREFSVFFNPTASMSSSGQTGYAFCPMFGLDDWGGETRIWMVYRQPGIQVFRDTGSGLALLRDFAEDIRTESKQEPGMVPPWHFGGMFLSDPSRSHLYMNGMGARYRFEISDSAIRHAHLSYDWQIGMTYNSIFGYAKGFVHLNDYGGKLYRLNPDSFKLATTNFGVLPVVRANVLSTPTNSQVPFTGNLNTRAFGVAPDGSVILTQGDKTILYDSLGIFVDTLLLWKASFLQTDARKNIYASNSPCRGGIDTLGITSNQYSVNRYGYRSDKTSPLWSQTGFWGNGAMCCVCWNSNFYTDASGRSFIPKQFSRTIEVVDANGNWICNVGRYGNRDDVSSGPDGLSLALCSYIATDPDKWLYVLDHGNVRIAQVKLDYANTVIVGDSLITKLEGSGVKFKSALNVGVYPNPFNSFASFMLDFISQRPDMRYSLDVYDIRGKHICRVAEGVSGEMGYVRRGVVWGGVDGVGKKVGPGMYFYRFSAGDKQAKGVFSILR